MPGSFIPSFDGVLLAAGQSRRMGCDKALIPVAGGGTLWERQVDVLRAAGVRTVWVSARPDRDGCRAIQPWSLTSAWMPARWPVWWRPWMKSEASHLLVLAVDLPALPVSWLVRLMNRADAGGGVAGTSRHRSV